MELMSVKSPNPSLLSRARSGPMVPLCAPLSLRFQPLLRHHGCRVSALGLGFGFGFTDGRRRSLNRSIVAFAASHEESKRSDIEVEKEKGDHGWEGAESNEAWKQAIASFKEQALKLQSLSEEAYKVNSEKAMAILKETSEQLRIQAEKSKADLSVIAKEFGKESREYILKAAEDSPEDVKEILEALPSADDFSDISKTRDYHIGLSYGLFLFSGGFLSFMLTGSIPAIRFGVILGGALLILAISSMKSQRKGESHTLKLKGQTAISAIIFLREIHLLSQKSSFLNLLSTIVSGAVVAFYVYKINVEGKKKRGSNLEHGTES